MSYQNRKKNGRTQANSGRSDNSTQPEFLDQAEYFWTVTKGKSDPIWFCYNILGLDRLLPFQERAIRDFYAYRYSSTAQRKKEMVLACGMRGGKTALASMMGTYEFWCLITEDNPAAKYRLIAGQKIFITTIAVSKDIAEDGVFSLMKGYIQQSPWFKRWKPHLEFKVGRIKDNEKNVIIQVLGSWATTAVGRSNICVIFDELDLFEETNGKRSARQVYSRVRKSTVTFKEDGHIIALSSPKSEHGIILSLWREKKDFPEVLAYRTPTWEMNPEYTEEELKYEFRNDMPSFYRDFACLPEIAGGKQFAEGIKTTVMRNVLESWTHKDIEHSRIMAVDPAVTKDRFGIAVGYIEEGRLTVDGVFYLEKEYGETYLRESEVIKFIKAAIKALNVNVFIFDAWIMAGVIEVVDDELGLEIVKHVVSKVQGYDDWAGLQEPSKYGSRFVLVSYDPMEEEADQLIVKAGKVPNVDHTSTSSKDICDCVANLCWYYVNQDEAEEIDNKKDAYKPQVITSIPMRW